MLPHLALFPFLHLELNVPLPLPGDQCCVYLLSLGRLKSWPQSDNDGSFLPPALGCLDTPYHEVSVQ